MTSQLMVKINVAPFSQVNKSKGGGVNGELLTLSRPADAKISDKSPDKVRIAQLEHNIKFLQEQHAIMLNDLHNEIETLRNKNRDMQFQLMFTKGTPPTSSTSSSGSDDETKHKIYSSPNQHFTPSLHVELLEKVVNDLKSQLQENESRNVYLAAIVDEQKKKLERYEREREREQRAAQSDPDARRKLDEAESTIRRLQKENTALRRENQGAIQFNQHHHQQQQQQQQQSGHHHQPEQQEAYFHGHQRDNGSQQRSPNGYQKNGSQHQRSNQGRHNNHRRSNNQTAQYNNGRGDHAHWFPPLQTQNFYQQNRPASGNPAADKDEGLLPNLQHHRAGQFHHHNRRSANNNHHHQHQRNQGEARHRNGKEAS